MSSSVRIASDPNGHTAVLIGIERLCETILSSWANKLPLFLYSHATGSYSEVREIVAPDVQHPGAVRLRVTDGTATTELTLAVEQHIGTAV